MAPILGFSLEVEQCAWWILMKNDYAFWWRQLNSQFCSSKSGYFNLKCFINLYIDIYVVRINKLKCACSWGSGFKLQIFSAPERKGNQFELFPFHFWRINLCIMQVTCVKCFIKRNGKPVSKSGASQK